MKHRGACGCETNTGDGAGILLQTPHEFFAEEADKLKIKLPEPGRYGVGAVFLPADRASREACERLFEQAVREEGQELLGWRTVPTDNSSLGPTARASQPIIRQIIIGQRGAGLDAADQMPALDDLNFDRKLYVIRRKVRHAARKAGIPSAHFYIPSLSSRTIVYKGMLNPEQLRDFYPDLASDRVVSALAMVHSRFSTNTFPNWSRAHPYRLIAHNGEINTLRGNVNWMHARESMFASKLFGDDLKKLIPVIDTDGSDSAQFDNVLELLMLAGRSLPHAIMMMIPEPWSNHESMSAEKKAFYEFHGCLMEPWDGPASVAFTDGIRIGAVLDRNGLRPSRYYVTKDGLVVMASEVGVLDIPAERVLEKGRLQPGRMFLVDTAQGRIISDDEIKHQIASAAPYGEWLKDNLVSLSSLPAPPTVHAPDHETVLRRQEAFGYTTEDLKVLVAPMAVDGVEPTGSMGNDAPLAVLSERPQLLYSYFKQLFAQVTNPPVDAIREELIMAVDTAIGPEGNLLEPTPTSARQITLPTPVLRNAELEKLRHLNGVNGSHGFKSITVPMLFKVADGRRWAQARHRGAAQALQRRHRQRAQHHHHLRPRPRPRQCADPGVARGVGGAAPPAARRVAHARRPGRRDRRAARGAPLLPAARLRRERDQPVPGVRDHPRHDPRGRAARGQRPREGRAEVREGRRQGHRQGLLEDGDLDHPELPRRAGVRGDRAQQRLHRRVLHLDGVAHRRHRPARGRRRGAPAPPARVPGSAAADAHAGSRRAVPVPPRRRVPPVQPGEHPQAAVRLPHRQLLRLQGVREAGRRPGQAPVHAARPDGAGLASPAGADRRGRVGRRRWSSASRPARCRTARSAARRTRRWRSR